VGWANHLNTRLLRRILIGLLVLAAAAGLVLGARILFADRASPWRVVVPTIATVILVATTGVYAWLTHRLVQLSDPHIRIRAEIEEHAVADVATILATQGHRLTLMYDEYPLQITDGSPPDLSVVMRRVVDDIYSMRRGIEAHLQNLPRDIFEDAALLIAVLVRAEHGVLALGVACSIESAAADREKRGWTAAGAKSADYTVVSKGQRRSWDDMVTGAHWKLAAQLAAVLEARIEGRAARR
jgi:hypothetical protein